MSRELRRLLIEPRRLEAAGELLELRPPERHYLLRVLRFRPGDRLAVVDGAGHLWTAVLADDAGAEPGRLRLEQPLAAPLLREAPPAPPLTLAMAVPKREAELVWRMATELGADRLQPLTAERSARPGSLPLERWSAVLREACEQCERLWLPSLEPVQEAESWLARPAEGLALLATTRRPGLEPLARLLGEGAAGRAASLSLAIGPEGGWSEAEERRAEAAGWRPVSLGATILRTGTAALAGLSLLAAARQLSSSSSPAPSP